MIKLRQPLCFTEQGMKDNQEDYLYPLHANAATRTFILCDGMGGHDKGEVASATAANAIGLTLDRMQHSGAQIGAVEFAKALAAGYDALDTIDTGSTKKPGTTLTCLCFNENSYLAAHMGDSRIYHIRPSDYNPATHQGGILYQSSDHSLVNDLLKAGELTEQEARDFPQRNIITRAMQPHLDTRYKAETYCFNDVEGGDYFFMCCDGVLERLDNYMLVSILSNVDMTDADKLAAIKAICDQGTRDNYTCWLIPVDQASIPAKRKGPIEGNGVGANIAGTPHAQVRSAAAPMAQAAPKSAAPKPSALEAAKKRERFFQNRLNVIILTVGIIAILTLAWLGWSWYSNGEAINVDTSAAPEGTIDARTTPQEEAGEAPVMGDTRHTVQRDPNHLPSHDAKEATGKKEATVKETTDSEAKKKLLKGIPPTEKPSDGAQTNPGTSTNNDSGNGVAVRGNGNNTDQKKPN